MRSLSLYAGNRLRPSSVVTGRERLTTSSKQHTSVIAETSQTRTRVVRRPPARNETVLRRGSTYSEKQGQPSALQHLLTWPGAAARRPPTHADSQHSLVVPGTHSQLVRHTQRQTHRQQSCHTRDTQADIHSQTDRQTLRARCTDLTKLLAFG